MKIKNYIQNKTVLITGATSGIGKQLAINLSVLDCHLVLVARDIEKLQALKEGLQKKTEIDVAIYQLDVRDKSQVTDLMAKIVQNKTIDILINNAGLALGLNRIDSGDMDQWDDMIDTNVKGLLYVSRAVIPQMRTLPTAHIVNIGSVAGKSAYPKGNVYCATKAAVHSLGQSMNADLLGTAIKVTTVAPGAVETNFSNVRFLGDKKKAQSVYQGYTPLSAQDISELIVYVLNTPKHVNIQHVDIMPTAQRSPYLLDNSGH